MTNSGALCRVQVMRRCQRQTDRETDRQTDRRHRLLLPCTVCDGKRMCSSEWHVVEWLRSTICSLTNVILSQKRCEWRGNHLPDDPSHSVVSFLYSCRPHSWRWMDLSIAFQLVSPQLVAVLKSIHPAAISLGLPRPSHSRSKGKLS